VSFDACQFCSRGFGDVLISRKGPSSSQGARFFVCRLAHVRFVFLRSIFRRKRVPGECRRSARARRGSNHGGAVYIHKFTISIKGSRGKARGQEQDNCKVPTRRGQVHVFGQRWSGRCDPCWPKNGPDPDSAGARDMLTRNGCASLRVWAGFCFARAWHPDGPVKGSGPCFRPTLVWSVRSLLAEKWTRPRLCWGAGHAHAKRLCVIAGVGWFLFRESMPPGRTGEGVRSMLSVNAGLVGAILAGRKMDQTPTLLGRGTCSRETAARLYGCGLVSVSREHGTRPKNGPDVDFCEPSPGPSLQGRGVLLDGG